MGKRPFRRPAYRWENNFKIDLQEVGWAWTRLMWLRIGTGVGLL